ncbi:helix-turn-helix domain-containing protein [Clostridioides sp. ZZV14-6150]|uniref:helix-turn-helix domain-containing protein n=1 Tax=Clostridioides sp. ZZV14-6150 TaxID=2811493 RepID=UPI001D126262|nr:helix-turn-helix domain-containing protein [Clostridioides sp. ZZV14-6150]
MGVGENIKTFRKDKMMTQEQLAEKAGISRVALGNYEREERVPSLEILEKLAVALDTSTHTIINLNILSLEDIYDIKIIQNEYVPLTSMQKKKIKDSLESYSLEMNIDTICNIYDDFSTKNLYMSRAFMYTLLNRFEEALDDYNNAISLDRNFSQAYLKRGELYSFLGFKDKAKKDFNKYIEIHFGDNDKFMVDSDEEYDIVEKAEKKINKQFIKNKFKNSPSLYNKIDLLNDDCLDLISNLVDKLMQDKNNLK